jgi:hypothetical protein
MRHLANLMQSHSLVSSTDLHAMHKKHITVVFRH